MLEDKKQQEKEIPFLEGYQPLKNNNQAIQGNIDASKPPKGGSGVPSSSLNNNNIDKSH